MISQLLSRLIILGLGTLYPAYRSYKAIKTKDVREYVKWMMYWIVFAIFTVFETFTDFFLAFWFPFYYELKIVMVVWLLSPATKGSSILYRRFVHPWLVSREEKIDGCIDYARQQSYNTVKDLGQKMIQHTSRIVMANIARAPAMLEHIVRGQDDRLGRADIIDITDLSPSELTQLSHVRRSGTGTPLKSRRPVVGKTVARTVPDLGGSRYRSVRRAASDDREGESRGGGGTLPRSKRAGGVVNNSRMTQSMNSVGSFDDVRGYDYNDNEAEEEVVVMRGGGEVVIRGGAEVKKSVRGRKKVTPVRKSSRRLTK